MASKCRDIEIVAAIDVDKNKVGRDLGEVMGLDLVRDTGLSEEGVQEKLGRLRQNAFGRWEWKCHLAAVIEALKLMPDSLQQYAQRINCPTLVTREKLITLVSHEEAVADMVSLRHGQLAEIEKAPHDIVWYNFEGMMAALRDFLKDK